MAPAILIGPKLKSLRRKAGINQIRMAQDYGHIAPDALANGLDAVDSHQLKAGVCRCAEGGEQ